MKGAPPKPSTEYQRAFRERMRQRGLVKKDVWIRPEHAGELAAVERRLREPEAATGAGQGEGAGVAWTVRSLHDALGASRPVLDGSIVLELIEGAEPGLHLVMRDYGDLPVFVAVGAEQVVVEALMWPVDHVADPVAFNTHVLRVHKLLPLSTIGIDLIGGEPCYTMFGSLDTRCSLASALREVQTLADNVLDAAEAWAPYLRPDIREPEGVAA